MKMVVSGIIVPSEAALMGLLTISLLYAAIRLLRRRVDLMSIIFLVTAAFVILGTASLPFGAIPLVSDFSRWLTEVLALGGAHHVRVFRLPEAAVVAPEGAEKVTLFDVQIVTQYGATVAQVCSQMKQVVIVATDDPDPERHDLHEAACAR